MVADIFFYAFAGQVVFSAAIVIVLAFLEARDQREIRAEFAPR